MSLCYCIIHLSFHSNFLYLLISHNLLKMKSTPFFRITAWIAFFLSFYSCLLFIVRTSFLWIPIGLSLSVIFLCIVFGTSRFNNRLKYGGINHTFSQFIIKISSVTYFGSSMYGLVDIIFRLPIYDRSFLMMPVLIFACFFAGASVNLAQLSD